VLNALLEVKALRKCSRASCNGPLALSGWKAGIGAHEGVTVPAELDAQ
jgi:hypothetical protein